jgi:hypothetical protein
MEDVVVEDVVEEGVVAEEEDGMVVTGAIGIDHPHQL